MLQENSDFIVDVALPGEAALIDLDTPAAWSRWRARQAEGTAS
ncbi:MAG: hypothetical protein AAF317_13720 [Pseudomonadota bacterium]